jgi:chemotaxis response regulator CheB
MPETAIASGFVDYVMTPEAIAQKIIGIALTALHQNRDNA